MTSATLSGKRTRLACCCRRPAGNSHCTSELLPKRRRRVFLDNVPAGGGAASAPRRVRSQTDQAATFHRLKIQSLAYSKFHRPIFQRATRHLNVVERNGVIGELLVFFVPFAGDQDDVARLRQRRGTSNRFRAIRDFLVMGRAKSFLDFGDDRVRIFLARIVGSDDAVIGDFDRPRVPSAAAFAGRDRRRTRRPR